MEVFHHDIRVEVLGSIFSDHVFSSASRNNFHLPCCSLSTYMAQARGRDSHVGEGMLNYSIRLRPTCPFHIT
jgi:hypothetical protein